MKSRFQLARATADDMPEIVEIQFRANPSTFVREVFMAADTPEGHASLAQQYQNGYKENPSTCWIKVIDTATNQIAAASYWGVYVGGLPEPKIGVDISWLQGDQLDRARRVWAEILAKDQEIMTGPCLSMLMHCVITLSSLNIR